MKGRKSALRAGVRKKSTTYYCRGPRAAPPHMILLDNSGSEHSPLVIADPDSDFLTCVNMETNAARRFCKENYLKYVALHEMEDTRCQFHRSSF